MSFSDSPIVLIEIKPEKKKLKRECSFPTAAEIKISEEVDGEWACSVEERKDARRSRNRRRSMSRSTNNFLKTKIDELTTQLNQFSSDFPGLTSTRYFSQCLHSIIWAMGRTSPSTRLSTQLAELDPSQFLNDISDLFEEIHHNLTEKELKSNIWAKFQINFSVQVSHSLPHFMLSCHWPQIEIRSCNEEKHIDRDTSHVGNQEFCPLVPAKLGVFATQDIPKGTQFPWFGIVTNPFFSDQTFTKHIQESFRRLISSSPSRDSPCFEVPSNINIMCHIHCPSRPHSPNMVFRPNLRYFCAARNIRKGEELTAEIDNDLRRIDFAIMRYISLCHMVKDDEDNVPSSPRTSLF